MFRKNNDYKDMTIDEFKWLLSKEERKEFKRYIAVKLAERHEVEA